MSNLKLPTLDFATLDAKLGNKRSAKIGYETYATRMGDFDEPLIDIIHHSTVIAEVADNMAYIPYTGYHSKTTADRIHKVLTGTGAFQDSGYTLAIRQHQLCLIHRDSRKPLASFAELGDLQWNRDSFTGEWSLALTDQQKDKLAA